MGSRRGRIGRQVTFNALLGLLGGCSTNDHQFGQPRAEDAGQPSGAASSTGGKASSTGGSSGLGANSAGTDAGAGGASEPAADCESDEDCDDLTFCNGVESCVKGACVKANAPCENPDEAHCSVTCAEGETAAKCQVDAIDADADEHGSAECEENPGDDCDDTLDSVYPGAPELCDGLDNDCDERIDVRDGLKFGGVSLDPTAGTFGYSTSSFDLTWLESQQAFGFGWTEESGTFGRGFQMDVWGPRGQSKLYATSVMYSVDGFQTRIVAGDNGFGMAYVTSGLGWFVFTNVSGDQSAGAHTPLDDIQLGPRIDLAYSESGTFAMVSDGIGMTAQSFSSFLSPVTLVPSSAIGDSRIIGLKKGFVFAGVGVQPVVLSDKLDDPKPLDATLDTRQIMMASASTRFATTSLVAETTHTELSVFTAAGKRTCGPTPVGLDGYTVADLVATETGYTLMLVADTEPPYIKLQEVSADCIASEPLDTPFTSLFTAFEGGHSRVSLSYGSQGYALAYSNPDSGRATAAFFGKGFCD